jgi:integrase
MTRLTKRIVDAVPVGSTVWDSELKGFGCRRRKSGAAFYVLKYRAGDRQRWLTIGEHGKPWTPDAARKRAAELFFEIRAGGDPAAKKVERREGLTVYEFADRYDRDWIELHKKPSSASSDRYNLKNHVRPKLGRILMAELDGEDVRRLHRTLKNKPTLANRVVALVSHMCTKAEEWGVRERNSNPCREVKFYREAKRDRYLTTEEMNRLGKALDAADGTTVSTYAVNAIRLLAMTGARLGEVLNLQWRDVDLERKLLLLRDSKTGSKPVLLSDTEVALLNALPRKDDNPHVFCGKRNGSPLVNIQKPWRAIRDAAGLEDVRLHDLRHSFASVAANQGASLPMIGALLGHKQVQTTARYAHLAHDPTREVKDRTETILNRYFGTGAAEPE